MRRLVLGLLLCLVCIIAISAAYYQQCRGLVSNGFAGAVTGFCLGVNYTLGRRIR